ncbi:MAG: hypothetical protein AB2792_07670 [Candidatus Thiodiazotropha sp.]
MNEIICKAIQEKRLLSFTYKGYRRVVEPHTHGISTANNECLRCYQVSGGSVSGRVPDWKMMTTNNIDGLTISDDTFECPRDGYRKNDSGMHTIFCEL